MVPRTVLDAGTSRPEWNTRSPSWRGPPPTLTRVTERDRLGPRAEPGLRLATCSLVLAVIASVTAACGSDDPAATPTPAPHVVVEPSARVGQLPISSGGESTQGPIGTNPSKAGGVELDVLSGLLDDQPIYNGDFADPFVLRTPDSLFVYASNTTTTQYAKGVHVPVIELSRDSGFEGQYLGDALPTLPTWTVPGYQWAPAVWTRPDGTYVLYYSTPATIPLGCLGKTPPTGCVHSINGPTSAMCISRATSTNPSGP